VTPRSPAEAEKLRDEVMLSEHDEIRSDGEDNIAHDPEKSTVAKVACERCRRRKVSQLELRDDRMIMLLKCSLPD
jgi:hypothetical protein